MARGLTERQAEVLELFGAEERTPTVRLVQ